MTTENHEVVFAIVNAGYADAAMEVAREAGARGGTILNAGVSPRKKKQPSLESPSTLKKRSLCWSWIKPYGMMC